MPKPVYCHLKTSTFDADYAAYERAGAPLELCIYGEELDQWKTNGVADKLARLKRGYDPPTTLHGPVYGWDPASKDGAIRELAWRRLKADFEIAALIDPETIVFHSSYNHYQYGFIQDYWIETTADFYRRALAELPGKARLAIENIYDTDPEPLCKMIAAVDDPRLGHCFDIGHFTMFQKNYAADRWLAAFAGKLYHLHVHDNRGREDLHLPPGQGSIDYRPLIAVLEKTAHPFSATIEGLSPEANFAGVDYVRRHFPTYGI
ncbi:MAG: sugar phosphate isomerase/epimerase [Myxococcales bacterium]|nr:MAG: sugar phosphate isomerase/epimerase [Myxococcales bacterium]